MSRTQRTPCEPLERRTLLAAHPAAATATSVADGGNGSIAGTVYYDANNSWQRDPGESGLSARVAYLDLDEDNEFDPGERWVTTDAAGAYLFAGLAAGRHAVRVLHPEGWQATATTVHFVSLQAGQSVGGRDFGSSNTGRLTVYAFNDLDRNGLPAGGTEPKLAGRTVYLDADGNARLDPGERSGVSTSAGLVSFPDVQPGSYVLRQVVPAGWTDTAGGRPVAVNNHTIRTFHLGSFGPAVYAIHGTAFHDLDADGARGPAEPALAGQTVFLDRDNSITLTPADQSVVTGADGTYRFDDMPAGHYTVRGMPPSGWFHTSPSPLGAGTVNITGDAAALVGPTFGAAATSPSAGAVHGAVFHDADGDGQRDAGERGVPGLPVYLDLDGDRTNGPSEPRLFTDSRGEYAWGNVAGPSVGVGVLATSPGWVFTAAGGNYAVVPVAPGQRAAAEFGTRAAGPPPGSIAGTVFRDYDRDGRRDLGDGGVHGQTVWIDRDGDGLRGPDEPAAWTNADGAYLFVGLPAGTHAVRLVVEAPYDQTAPAGGTWLVTLAGPDAAAIGRDFGHVPGPSAVWVRGTTYEDVNANGVRDPGEENLIGTPVYVDANRDGFEQLVEPSTLISGVGGYALPPIAPGEHRIRFVLPSGTRPTSPAAGFADRTFGPGEEAIQDFGYTYKALVRGTVFQDADEDGARDQGEQGLAGRTVYLDADADAVHDPGEPSAGTDAAGAYAFPAVLAGTYVVRQVIPPGWRQTSPGGSGGHQVILGTGQVRDVDLGTAPTVRTVRAAADAHVRDGGFAGTNYGGAEAMEVRLSSHAGHRREAYLRFDLAQVPSAAQIASATLRLYGRLSAAGGVTVGLYPVASGAWTEPGVKWSNRPAAGGTALGTRTLAGTAAAWVEYDVTGYLRQQKAAGATSVSLALRATNYTTPHAIVTSDEAAGGRPELRVTQQVGGPVSPPVVPPPAPAARTFRASADAYVQDGSAANTNYGSGGELQARLSSFPGNWRESYLRFDLAQVPPAGQITSAKVRLWGRLSAAGSANVGLFAVANNAWTEPGLKWSNKPAATGTPIGTRTIGSTAGGWVEYDLTAYLKQQKAAGATSVNLALKATNHTSPHATFASDEAAANRPELVVG